MKKILFLLPILFLANLCHAAWSDDFLLGRSSFTATDDSVVSISTGAGGSPNFLSGAVFDGVVISSNSSAGGTVTFYDSILQATNEIGFVSMTGTGSNYIPFEVHLSSGLTYTVSGVTRGISIIYKITRPY